MELAQDTRVTIVSSGAMRLSLDGRDVTLTSRKSLALLTYLALQPGRADSRERVASLLWSDSGPDQARAALRQTLRRLKADLGEAEDLIDADRSELGLTRPVRLDIVQAIEQAGRGLAPDLLTRDDADLSRLFVGLEDLDPDFNLWIAVQRERLSAQLVARLEAALAAAEGDAERLVLAEALRRADPTHEGACRAAMQAHMTVGDVAQAMRCYERLWSVLDEELDVEPSEKTQALYVAIKQGRETAPAPRPEIDQQPGAEPELRAPIAIIVEQTLAEHLPQDYAYFAGTFRHDMIAALSRFRDWLVIDGQVATGSPPTYRAYDLRIAVHGQQGGIVVSMTLIDRQDGRCVWSDRRMATLDGLVALHQTALRNLAVALNIHLSTSRLQSSREVSSPLGRRYELWIQAQALMGEWRAEAEARAEAILRELIATSPSFAPAMVALAQIINARPIVYPGKRRRRERLEESLSLTSRAVNLDPLDSRTHLSRSWAHAIAGSHSAALSHLDLALDLNENDPWTIISAGLGFAFAGELDRATELVEQARGFGMSYSRAAQGYVATTLYLCGDYAGSATAAEVAGDAITNLPAWQAASLMQLGDAAGAGRAMTTFIDLALASWVGDPNPTEADAIGWFMGCFPIKDEEVRADLRHQLERALRARKGRQP